MAKLLFSATKIEEQKNSLCMFLVRFGFGVYVKAVLGFKAFYFYGSVSLYM